VKKGARIELAFSGEKPGKAEIACALDFYICTEKWCVRQKRDAKVPVTVQ
jgi:hypothetical protein